jgi:AbrB family looped-hinge helix DNA binding protein
MRTTIDAAGRLVVPKPLRDELGLESGTELELEARDGALEVSVPAIPMRLERQGNRWMAVTDQPMPALTADEVRATLERVRR